MCNFRKWFILGSLSPIPFYLNILIQLYTAFKSSTVKRTFIKLDFLYDERWFTRFLLLYMCTLFVNMLSPKVWTWSNEIIYFHFKCYLTWNVVQSCTKCCKFQFRISCWKKEWSNADVSFNSLHFCI